MSSLQQRLLQNTDKDGNIITGESFIDEVSVESISHRKSLKIDIEGTEQAIYSINGVQEESEKDDQSQDGYSQDEYQEGTQQNGQSSGYSSEQNSINDDDIGYKNEEDLASMKYLDENELQYQEIEMQIFKNDEEKDIYDKQDERIIQNLKDQAQKQPKTQKKANIRGEQMTKTIPHSQTTELQKKQTPTQKPKTKSNHNQLLLQFQKDFKMNLKNNQNISQQTSNIRFKLSNLLNSNLFLRKCWRIFLLILIIFVFVGLTIAFYYYFGFVRGSKVFKSNDKIKIYINSCTLMIYDLQFRETKILNTSFLSGSLATPGSLDSDETIYMQWIYPDAAAYSDKDSTFDDVTIKKQILQYFN